MKYTLLELVQTILSSMESDEVDSISDTPESLAVATVVRTAYYDLITRLKLPVNYDLFQLIGSGSALTPVTMFLPSDVEQLEWVRYDETPSTVLDKKIVDKLTYRPIDDFMELTYNYASTNNATTSYTVTSGTSALTAYCLTDQAPRYYTTFNESTVLFDGYDSSTEAMLQASKTTCWGKKQYTFTFSNDFVPQLDEQQFALLLNEAKGLAWFELRQTPHERAEKKVKQHLIASQYNKDTIGDTQTRFQAKLPNYGRKR
jgi:hypothetical protein